MIAKKYRKKPVMIEAIQWTGKNIVAIRKAFPEMKIGWEGDLLFIPTLEGVLGCYLNDYIIKGIKGEFYPCKEDIFNLTYEEVKSE